MRIFTALAATSAAVVVLTASSAQAAPASPSVTEAGSCSLVAPARVGISAPYTEITLRTRLDCTSSNTSWAAWEQVHPSQGPINGADFDFEAGQDTYNWDVYDTDPLGNYRWRPFAAYDTEGNSVSQDSPYTDVRVASWASLTGTRSGGTVNLNVSVARYSGTYERYIPWTKKVGAIQILKSGSNTWTHFGYVGSNASGKATFTGAIASTTQVRVIFPNETYIWGVWTPGRTI